MEPWHEYGEMPIYEYRCQQCDQPFELLVRSDTSIECSRCGCREVDRLISRPARPGSATASTAAPSGGGCGSGGCGCH